MEGAANENKQEELKLDYSLETSEERTELVNKIVAQSSPEKLTNRYLESLANYILYIKDKEERKKRKILTDNRLTTVNAHETSYEGLVGKLENGEDGIYNMIINDKNVIFKHKDPITEKDVAEIEPLRKLREAIESVKESYKKAEGKRKFLLKSQIIEMSREQYTIRNEFRQTKYSSNLIKSIAQIDLSENITIDASGNPQSDGLINFFNPQHISLLLCNYSSLKEECYAKSDRDLYYAMMDLDNLVEAALANSPMLKDLLIYKIDGMQNADIQKQFEIDYGFTYSAEYISSLWRKKIPKLIAEKAAEEYLIWYYTEKEVGYWKRCSRCGQIKLGHNKFFSKNKTSKDGWYSICKECRNAKK